VSLFNVGLDDGAGSDKAVLVVSGGGGNNPLMRIDQLASVSFSS